MDDLTYRHLVQEKKILTHFRGNIGEVLEYPDLDLFLNKYGNKIRNDVTVFAYFFHLYADHYYFRYFLPKYIEFYDKDMNITNTNNNNCYTKIKKDNKVLETKIFFSKLNEESLYVEYKRFNNYILNKYKPKYLYFNDDNYYLNVSEVPKDFSKKMIDTLNKEIDLSLSNVDNKLRIFNEKDIDDYLKFIVNKFMEEYDFYKSYV